MSCYYVTVPAKSVTFKVYFEDDIEEEDALKIFLDNVDELDSEFIDFDVDWSEVDD